MYLNIPAGLFIKEYRITGYLQGERVCVHEGLTLEHFDVISFFGKSKCQITKRDVIHVIGHRKLEKRETVIIMRKTN